MRVSSFSTLNIFLQNCFAPRIPNMAHLYRPYQSQFYRPPPPVSIQSASGISHSTPPPPPHANVPPAMMGQPHSVPSLPQIPNHPHALPDPPQWNSTTSVDSGIGPMATGPSNNSGRLCMVCGEPRASPHYGIICCFACMDFFRRRVVHYRNGKQERREFGRCMTGRGDCVITKGNFN